MDIKNLIGGNSVTLELVRNSPTKRAIVLSGGAMKEMIDKKEKLSMLVEMDGRQVNWIPNKTSMKNVASAYGLETNGWIGKAVRFEEGIVQGKTALLAWAVTV